MEISSEAEKRNCGGILTTSRGILTSPNFPGPFEVPKKCQWVIDASNASTQNASIVVYFTQLFLFEGLSFTEYQIYGNDYKINPKLIHKVNETNITRVRWIQTHQAFLVIELDVLSLDSAHLRVLENFLDIYGFNITYEITSAELRSPSCTMMDCGFTGVCYDYYTKFACECFSGYAGPSCSEGPKSLCDAGGSSACKNGATCLHVGVSAIKCHCPDEFTGKLCEVPKESANFKGCSNCSNVCDFTDESEGRCKCTKSDTKINRHGFPITLHMGNLPLLVADDLKNFIRLQLLNHLEGNIAKPEDLEITNLIYFKSGADVTFNIYGSKKDEKKIKGIITKWLDKRFVGNITVSEKDDSISTLLSLQSLDINQFGEINENDEFILSCVARGSPTMNFRWFKDGAAVNLTMTGYKWTKLIKDPHVTDQYMAILAVERAQRSDEGTFTCQVEVFNFHQCLSKFVKVKKKTSVKIEPMSLTVRKGQKFIVKCVTDDDSTILGKYTYSWTKNKELLATRTEFEKYEILYPAGTILQVFNAEKDVRYSCLVQDGATSIERNIYVYVIDDKKVHTCQPEGSYNLLWPETAPNADSILECPENFVGITTRKCILQDGTIPVWGHPDFSQCTHTSIRQYYRKFEEFTAGYSVTTPGQVLSDFLHYIKNVRKKRLLPGEGSGILQLTKNIVNLLPVVGHLNGDSPAEVTCTIFEIVDEISSIPQALINPADIRLLQEVIVNHLSLNLNLVRRSNLTAVNSVLNSVDVSVINRTSHTISILGTPKSVKKRDRILPTLMLPRNESDAASVLARIVYGNFSTFFPLKSFLRIVDGTEVGYEIFSQVVTVVSLTKSEQKGEFVVVFTHSVTAQLAKNGKRAIKCGYADERMFAYTWDIFPCFAQSVDHVTTKCRCSKYGSVVLLLIAQSEILERSDTPQNYILLLGSLIGIMFTLIATSCVGISCFLVRGGSYGLALELQCSFATFVFQVLFTMAVILEPPQQYLMVFITFLEMFSLVAISSNLSKVLVVFTELIEIPKAQTSKFTVTGIISGVPLITVFANHLTYRTMNKKFESWWMVANSLSFNIYIIVLSIVTLMFAFIYLVVIKKLQQLFALHETHRQAIQKRMTLVNQTGCVFISIMGFTISSVIYVNYNHSIWNTYQFTIASLSMGSSLLIFHVITSENKLSHIIKWRNEKDNSLLLTELTGKPLNFLVRQQAAKSENENAPGAKLENRQFCLNSIEGAKAVDNFQNGTKSFEYFQMSAIFRGETRKETVVTRDAQPATDSRSLDAQRQSNPENDGKLHSPDILTTKMCVELDLVASSIHVTETNAVEGNDSERCGHFFPQLTTFKEASVESEVRNDSKENTFLKAAVENETSIENSKMQKKRF
ncbi:uncharacterized protein LOC132703606 isoform X2 [Cylas formicarius]|uniref:uncharacterized protein LOC132703606 isoform X2 n=1 Tax=Cylas formicarius TaxID=197179 RepID=UPI002958AF6C|nr:uncharacterized protein LOC132703606 isoform X2 [Cylas formicarius]